MNDLSPATRREFLTAGAMGVAGTALLASCSGPAARDAPVPATPPSSPRTLGRTGLTLPIVSIGTAYAMNLVQRALDAGMKYIHTSSTYAERNHERMLGEALRGRPRESFVLGTSPDLPYTFRGGGLSDDVGVGVDAGLIGTSLRASLQLLGLDHVDIYYLASVNTRQSVLHDPYIKAFEQLKREGLTRFTGVVTHANEPTVIRAAAESGAWDVVVTAYNFRQSHGDQVADAIRQASEAGLGVIAMKTQAGVYWDRLRLRKINMKAALKWVVQNEHVHTTIPAFSNFDELREDLDVVAKPVLTPAELADLKLGETAGLTGIFCQQCGACLPQCLEGVDVRALMRASMYAVGYGDAAKARALMERAQVSDSACATCRACVVRCALGMDVRSVASPGSAVSARP